MLNKLDYDTKILLSVIIVALCVLHSKFACYTADEYNNSYKNFLKNYSMQTERKILLETYYGAIWDEKKKKLKTNWNSLQTIYYNRQL